MCNRFHRSIHFILLTALLTLAMGVNVFGVLSQDAPLTLRQLAEQRELPIGAAAWTNHLDVPEHAAILAQEFNMLTPEHEAKHCMIEIQPGVFDFSNFDRLVDFAVENDMIIRGHTLVWHSCMPSWIQAGAYTRDEAIQLMRDFITMTIERYKDRIHTWDVVNEAIADDGSGLRVTPWRELIGDDYIELAFQFAREADPDALLFYNDYGAEGMNSKSDAVYAMAQDFIARGIPLDGIGFQAHFDVGGINADRLAQNIERLGELGLQVQITELDIKFSGEPNEYILEQQARDYRRVLDTCLGHENCTAFVVWGVSDQFTWLRGSDLGFFFNPDVAPLLFDDDYAPKPAYFAVLDALALSLGMPSVLPDAESESPEETVERLDLPEPVKSDTAQLAPDAVDGIAYYAAFPVAITLDGETGDWANIPRVSIDNGPLLLPENDTTMTFAVAADATHLYFLADVQDSSVVYGQYVPADEWYREDSVEFYINATGDLALLGYETGVAQIAMLAANLENPETPIIAGGNSAGLDVQVVAVKTDTGYRIEVSVPLITEVWTIEPEHLGLLGFQAHLNGSSSTDRDTKLIWSAADTQDQSWTNPSLFGRLIFWDAATP